MKKCAQWNMTFGERKKTKRNTVHTGTLPTSWKRPCPKPSFAIHADRLPPGLQGRRLPIAGPAARDALCGVGVDAASIYHDFASGVRDDRPGLENCLRALRTGDLLVVWKLDRLGRNLTHLVNTVQNLSTRGVGLRVLAAKVRRSTPPPPLGASCSASSRRWWSSRADKAWRAPAVPVVEFRSLPQTTPSRRATTHERLYSLERRTIELGQADYRPNKAGFRPVSIRPYAPSVNAHTDGNRFRRCASAMAVQHGRTSQWFVPVAGSGSRMKV